MKVNLQPYSILFYHRLAAKLFCLILCLAPGNKVTSQPRYFITVTGKAVADTLNTILSHEHVVTNFIGADSIRPAPLKKEKALMILKPYFNRAKQNGIATLFECTPAFIGRDALLLKTISENFGIRIITNTGYYAAVNRKYIPSFVYSESEDQISKRWIAEFFNGIEATGVRPGFIKLGVGDGILDSVEVKLLKAAIITSKRTGMTIAIHTGDYEAAFSEYQVAISNKLPPEKLVWVHAQNATNEQRQHMAEMGMWISLDGISEKNIEEYTGTILFLKKASLLHRLLISHDDGWSVPANGSYNTLELFKNGNNVPYTAIPDKLIPALKLHGFTDREIEIVTKVNPVQCFAIKE